MEISDSNKKILIKIKKESEYTINIITRIINGDYSAISEAECFIKYLKNKQKNK